MERVYLNLVITQALKTQRKNLEALVITPVLAKMAALCIRDHETQLESKEKLNST